MNKVIPLIAFSVILLASAGMQQAFAGSERFGQPCLKFNTELTSFNLAGGPFPMPLASDPSNLLGDSIDGFGFVDSEVTITLSSQRAISPGPPSLGMTFAFPADFGDDNSNLNGECGEEEIDPDALDGQQFFADSFFDVFFDITVTDVDPDPGRDYAGQPDGASITLPDNGPANIQTFYFPFFDKDAPNFGLIPPPEVEPYIGHFLIEIPLGGDINANGEDDKIKFTLATHSVGDENRQFIVLPDGTVIDEFDSAAFLEGAIVDLSADPPFTIGALLPTGLPDPAAFGGPTTATSTLLNPLVNNPPDCSAATPSQDSLFPPNHKMNDISINGITDPDGDTVTITIDGITQDEPTPGPGKKNSPDGDGVGTNTAQVRAERLASGDGRVYEITFTADDGNGGTCTGSVQVGVPHNKKSTAVDSGQSFDSTQP